MRSKNEILNFFRKEETSLRQRENIMLETLLDIRDLLQDKEEVKECRGGTSCLENCHHEKPESTPPIPEKLKITENPELNIGSSKADVILAKKVNAIIDVLTFITKKR